MKTKLLLFFVLLLSMSLSATGTQSPREAQLLNFGWKFKMGNMPGAQAPEFDDAQWRDIDLPHDYQIEMPWDKDGGGARGFKNMGEAWYRTSFELDSAWKNKRILIDFEGIMAYGDVYLNGEKVGGTDYGYVGFEVDITSLARFGQRNVLAVYCSTGTKGGSRWYTGGGLFRDVHLKVKNELSVARHGLYVTTPKITNASAEVAVQVEIANLNKNKNDLTIAAKIFAPDGKLVGETTLLAPKTKKQYEEVSLPLVQVASPLLWSCETPHLYTAEVTLTTKDEVIDQVRERFGIRTLEYSKEFGFRLNGKKVFLKGISNHHDLGAVGAAAHERSIERQFKRLREFGFNHVRTSHNPYSESFLRLADEYGILITDELYDKWSNKSYWIGRKPWTELVFQNVTEWIKRDRNHPSVILWSLGNELQMREDLAGFPTSDWGVTTYRMLDVLVKRYDNTRPTTVAMFPARAGGVGKNDAGFNTNVIPPELATVTEVSSFNYRWFNYQEYLKHAPHMIIYQSEATTNELMAPYFGMDRDKMVGLAYWGAVAYWGESNGWPKKGWNYSFFDHALEPFPQAYLVRSAFDSKPMVYIGIADKPAESLEWNDQTTGTQDISSNWNREAGKNYTVYTYTNADYVELTVNGKSFGKQKNDTTDVKKRNIIAWQGVPYSPGKITAIAYTNGREVARHTLESTGKAVALKMVLESPDDWKADGMDLQYVKVYAVDAKGRTVPTSTNELTFDVTGAAKLIAVDNGDHYSDELFAGNKRKLHQGFAMAILRSGQKAGEVTISASAKGLKTVKKTVYTQ